MPYSTIRFTFHEISTNTFIFPITTGIRSNVPRHSLHVQLVGGLTQLTHVLD